MLLYWTKKRRRLKHKEVPLFHGDKAGDLKKLKLECGKNGEKLMQLLETLDQITFSEGQVEQRAKRKQVVTKINSVLDKNDKILERNCQMKIFSPKNRMIFSRSKHLCKTWVG